MLSNQSPWCHGKIHKKWKGTLARRRRSYKHATLTAQPRT